MDSAPRSAPLRMASARARCCLALALFALAATAAAAAIIPTADPYTIRTSTDAQLVDVDDPIFNFTRHGWRRQQRRGARGDERAAASQPPAN